MIHSLNRVSLSKLVGTPTWMDHSDITFLLLIYRQTEQRLASLGCVQVLPSYLEVHLSQSAWLAQHRFVSLAQPSQMKAQTQLSKLARQTIQFSPPPTTSRT